MNEWMNDWMNEWMNYNSISTRTKIMPPQEEQFCNKFQKSSKSLSVNKLFLSVLDILSVIFVRNIDLATTGNCLADIAAVNDKHFHYIWPVFITLFVCSFSGRLYAKLLEQPLTVTRRKIPPANLQCWLSWKSAANLAKSFNYGVVVDLRPSLYTR